MQHRFFLEVIFKLKLRIYQVHLLGLEFLLNLTINFNVLHLHVGHILVQVFVNAELELLVVVDVLSHPVNCIFVGADINFVTADRSA